MYLLARQCVILFAIFIASSTVATYAATVEVPPEEYERGPLLPDQAFAFNSVLQSDGSYIFDWNIAPYYYMYKNKFKFETSQPLALTTQYSNNDQPYDDPYFGDLRVYRNTATVDLQIQEPLTQPVTMVISYQGCWDGGVCYPPQKIEIMLLNTTGNAAVTQSTFNSQSGVLSSSAPQSASFIEQLSQNTNGSTEPVDSDLVSNQPATTTSGNQSINLSNLMTNTEDQNFFLSIINKGNFLWLLLIFYLAGIALVFTPCVLPTIPLVSGMITRSSEHITPRKGFMMTLTFVLASSLTYSMIGIVVGLLGKNLQVLLQQPWIIVASAAIFVVLAAAMFGFFTLQMPTSLQQKINSLSGKQNHGSYYGLAIMGVLSTLIIGPCLTAPLAGILVYLGGQGSPLQGGASLFALGLGMGTPLLIAGTAAGKWLPKAGSWMTNIQRIFGFIMLLMAAWILDRVLSEGVVLLLYGITLVFFGVYIWQLTQPESRSGSSVFVRGLSIIIVLFGILQIIGYSTGNTNVYQPLQQSSTGLYATTATNNGAKPKAIIVFNRSQLESQIKIASASGKPAMVKFTAEWCIACEQIERDVFSDPAVMTQSATIYQIIADVSEVNDDALGLLDQYKIPGPPSLLFFDSRGSYRADLLLLGNITKEKVLARFDAILTAIR